MKEEEPSGLSQMLSEFGNGELSRSLSESGYSGENIEQGSQRYGVMGGVKALLGWREPSQNFCLKKSALPRQGTCPPSGVTIIVCED